MPRSGEPSTGRGPWTYERITATTPEDTVRREIIDGWLYVDGERASDPLVQMSSESSVPFHADAVRELLTALVRYRDEGHPGQVYTAPLDVRFGDHILQPDVFWLPEPAARYERPIGTRPVLVAEVSSPSTRGHDLVRKRRVYEASNVPEYWFVDTDARRFECYALQGERYELPQLVPQGDLVRSTALPGFQVAVDDVLGPEETGR